MKKVVKPVPANAEDTNLIPGPEDPTRLGNKPMSHNDWAHALGTVSCNYCAHVLRLLKSMHPPGAHAPQEKPLQWGAQAPQLEEPLLTATTENSKSSNKDPAVPENKEINEPQTK